MTTEEKTLAALTAIHSELTAINGRLEQLEASYQGIHAALGEWAKEQSERDTDYERQLDTLRDRVRVLERKLA